jgi:hypothetical protein
MNKADGSTQQSNSSNNAKQVERPKGAQTEEDGSAMNYPSSIPNPEFQTGNSYLNFNQDIHELNKGTNLTNEPQIMPSSIEPGTKLQAINVTHKKIQQNEEGDKGKEEVLEGLQMHSPQTIKRS